MHELLIAILCLLAIIDIAFIIVVVFFEKKDASATWAWILILVFLPVIGVILYFMIGQGISKNRRFKKKTISDGLKSEYFKKIQSDDEIVYINDKDKDLISMNYRNSNALYTCDNNMELIFDGKELYNDMIDEIKKAKKFIHMQFYIFRSDSWGSKLLDEMIKRAEDGVEVKLQVDGMGNFISKDYIKRLEKAGGEFLVFFPSILKTINLRANYRNHRKYLLIDGRCGYLGGFNIGKEYAGEGELGYWRDTHMKLRGEVLKSIESRFILDWTYTKKQDIDESFGKYFEIEPVD
ncbi:MAG: PLDc N-terminal domain-containing protein, partial [Clostridium sp.]|uniref:PLDc N-terminal domain-containing protein n=1 Tax=Clostridium sp. TaxID=1506 RepID=UPI003EE5CEB5